MSCSITFVNISDLLLFDLLFRILLFYRLRIHEGNKIQLINFSCSFARTKLIYGSVTAFNRYLWMLSTLLFNFVKLRSSPFSFRVRSDSWVVLALSCHLFYFTNSLLYGLRIDKWKNWNTFDSNFARIRSNSLQLNFRVRIFLFNVPLNKIIFYHSIYIILSMYYSSI